MCLVLISVVIIFYLLVKGMEQCQADCREPASFRLVRLTRPWRSFDRLGNALKLAKPYPFSIAGSIVDNLRFHLDFAVRIDVNETLLLGNQDLVVTKMAAEKDMVLHLIKESVNRNYESFQLKIVKESMTKNEIDTNVTSFELNVTIQVDAPTLDNGSQSIDGTYLQNLEADLKEEILKSNIGPDYTKICGDGACFVSRSIGITSKTESITLHAAESNPFSQFCELGCAYFFSSKSDPLHINECTKKCDDYYEYNITVGYNDLVEVARLECRDGCQMGLMRCQPGYKCSQVMVTKNQGDGGGSGDINSFDGGIMAHCPAGTYRDVAYNAVEECIPCPPGRFREGIKGRSLEGCNKCPSRTYNHKYGSSTIKDCLRCPAGTFTNEQGSAQCKCITPASCKSEFASPADAEKRDTVPFIGRW
jgi:hypothetical protein